MDRISKPELGGYPLRLTLSKLWLPYIPFITFSLLTKTIYLISDFGDTTGGFEAGSVPLPTEDGHIRIGQVLGKWKSASNDAN